MRDKQGTVPCPSSGNEERMECYFDNAATTRCCEEAAEFVMQALVRDYGNPSSMHAKGVEAEKRVKDAAAAIASTLKASPKEILFTSGGTESNNLAIFGTANAHKRRGNHIITTAVEHAAVLAPCEQLKKMGFDLTVLPVDETGRIRIEELEAALRPETILVSVMYANNEIGTLMPVSEIGSIIHEKSEALFHVDAIQGYGKCLIVPKKAGIDLMSVSSHKFHGPKGAGFLYVREGTRIEPLIYGGGQQNGMRSGTDNVPGITGMAAAAREACRDLGGKREHLYALKARLFEHLCGMEGVFLNGPDIADGVPHIMDVSFTGIRSEVLLHALEEKGVYVSAGSACSSHKRRPGGTLTAIGLPSERIESALRFSFCRDNTFEEVDYAAQQITQLLPMLRRYQRG